uniref:hypothetical protein n=1 Tax=Dialister sp. TaxID=1955814 RepID=UPI004027329D
MTPLRKLLEKTEPASSVDGLHKKEIGGVLRREISPWARRRIRHRRANHPWVRGRCAKLSFFE